jgi:hypothetical protein
VCGTVGVDEIEAAGGEWDEAVLLSAGDHELLHVAQLLPQRLQSERVRREES